LERWGILTLVLLLGPIASPVRAQNWRQDDQVFNPSGIPSLLFSQPRFADLDADGDLDLMLGSSENTLLYYRNIGTPTNPAFSAGPDIFAPVGELDAEVGVCIDLDGDGDLDLVTGGFSGLKLFENAGDAISPVFVEVAGFFSGLATGSNPVPALADLDGDQDFDLVVGLSESGVLKYYPNTGTPAAAGLRSPRRRRGSTSGSTPIRGSSTWTTTSISTSPPVETHTTSSTTATTAPPRPGIGCRMRRCSQGWEDRPTGTRRAWSISTATAWRISSSVPAPGRCSTS
jgi:hypothetical protein